jgi:sporulation protein YlmC with PRC-barrel domain
MTPVENLRVHRLGDLLGAKVTGVDGRNLGHVNDVRLAPGQAVRGVRAELVVEGIVVSDRHAGSMLGYDRRDDQGPWLVRRLVRRVHRNARYLPWSAVREVDWETKGISVDASSLQPLAGA